MRASRIDLVLTVRVARMQNLGAALKLEQFTTKFGPCAKIGTVYDKIWALR